MAPPSSAPNDVLLTKVSHLQTLLRHFTTTLATTTPPTSSENQTISPPPNPLQVLRDSSRLLHAHATKIGLLLLNSPFTPSAVLSELSACEHECLPAMMSAAETCKASPVTWTGALAREVGLRVEAVMSAFAALLTDVQTKAGGGTVRVERGAREKTLASTGQVWGACEGLAGLEKHGVAGFVVQKALEYRAMLLDALAELKGWGEDEEDLDEGFVGSDEDEEEEGVEGMFEAANRLPKHRADLRELLEEGSKRLRLVDMLFQALLKRRLRTFVFKEPPLEREDEQKMRRMNDLLAGLKGISESVDELANAFYELDADQARVRLSGIVEDARRRAEDMRSSWTGTDDEFTAWAVKWEEAVTKSSPAKT